MSQIEQGGDSSTFVPIPAETSRRVWDDIWNDPTWQTLRERLNAEDVLPKERIQALNALVKRIAEITCCLKISQELSNTSR